MQQFTAEAATAAANIPLDLQLPPGLKPPSKHPYLAACSIFKNEHVHILEWIKYHQWIGVGKFYIFDHGSVPSMSETLQPWIDVGVVDVLYFTNAWGPGLPYKKIKGGAEFASPQGWAYDSCFRLFGERHKFMVLLDVDEFIILRNTTAFRPDLPAFLKPFERFGGLMVHWQLLGSNRHRQRPVGGTLQSYDQCMGSDKMMQFHDFKRNPIGHMKAFVNTKYAGGGCNPHSCVLRGGRYANQNALPMGKALAHRLHWDKIVIYHYVTRSEEDYAIKLARGSGFSQFSANARKKKVSNRGWSYFHKVNWASTSRCLEGKLMYQRCFVLGQRDPNAPKNTTAVAPAHIVLAQQGPKTLFTSAAVPAQIGHRQQDPNTLEDKTAVAPARIVSPDDACVNRTLTVLQDAIVKVTSV